MLVFSSEFIYVFPLSFGTGSSWVTNAWLADIACVLVFKMLYPLSDTTSTHAGISTFKLKQV
jgi:hypothetical protein